jgi:hypothetical protein
LRTNITANQHQPAHQPVNQQDAPAPLPPYLTARAQAMLLLLGNDDAMCALLARWTEDAAKALRPVCKAFQRATQLRGVAWRSFDSLDAALDRLRLRYDLDPSRRWFEPVAAVVRMLYDMQLDNVIRMQGPAGYPIGFAEINILGFAYLTVYDEVRWYHRLVDLTAAHPAFQTELAGPYQQVVDTPSLAAYRVLKDLCWKQVYDTHFLGAYSSVTLGYRSWWVVRDNPHARLLRELRQLREAHRRHRTAAKHAARLGAARLHASILQRMLDIAEPQAAVNNLKRQHRLARVYRQLA